MSKTTPNFSQNQISELKETKKTKVVTLYKLTPKQFEPQPNPQNSLYLPQKSLKKTTFELDKITSKK